MKPGRLLPLARTGSAPSVPVSSSHAKTPVATESAAYGDPEHGASLATQKVLNARAAKYNPLAGGFNTVVLVPGQPDVIWRVTKGSDAEAASRASSLRKLWLPEARLTALLGQLDIAPHVLRTLGPGTWLFDTKHRGAMLVERMKEDLHEALFNRKAPLYVGGDKRTGHLIGTSLVTKCVELGRICMVHGDIKAENVLVKATRTRDGHTRLEVKMIDYDPKFIYAGMACFASMLRSAFPGRDLSDATWPCALVTILNLLLLWQFFELNHSDGDGAPTAVFNELARALESCDFPLDAVEPYFPDALSHRLKVWTESYRDKKLKVVAEKTLERLKAAALPADAVSIAEQEKKMQALARDASGSPTLCQRAVDVFPRLTERNFVWSSGPRVPALFPDPQHWTEARARLRDLLRTLPNDATCDDELSLPEASADSRGAAVPMSIHKAVPRRGELSLKLPSAALRGTLHARPRREDLGELVGRHQTT